MLNKINQLQKQNKEIDPETIKEIFPDDQSLLNEVIKMKDWEKEEEKRRKLDNYEKESIHVNKNYSSNFRHITQMNENNKKSMNKISKENSEDEEMR